MSSALLLPRCPAAAAVGLHRQNPTATTRAMSKFVFLPQLPFSLSSSRSAGLVASSSSSAAAAAASPSRRQPPSSTVFFPFRSLTTSDTSLLTSSVGSPTPAPPGTLVQWNLDGRHILVLNAVACIVAISASWLFLSAIPTLLAFKRAAESLEKLLDVTREELPDTMAAVRLSGMEISDLTMELSDLGEEITQGVRSSTRAVRLAEDRLQRLTMTPTASVKVEAIQMSKTEGPPVAKNARGLREGMVKGRAILGSLASLMRFTHLVWNFLVHYGQKRHA